MGEENNSAFPALDFNRVDLFGIIDSLPVNAWGGDQ